jgi:hypothetical protein
VTNTNKLMRTIFYWLKRDAHRHAKLGSSKGTHRSNSTVPCFIAFTSRNGVLIKISNFANREPPSSVGRFVDFERTHVRKGLPLQSFLISR